MPLALKNTLTGSLEPFAPLDPSGKRVTLYSCGPTVYSFAHIGNFRSFLFADVLRRVLERRGYDVRHVMNITDVGHMTEDHLADAAGEDKLAKAARELGSDPYKVAEHYERAFAEDATRLRLRIYQGAEATDPTLHPRATRYVPEMLAMIQLLLQRGFAYLDASGQAYFEVAKFPEYGQLSGKVLEDLEAGARVEVRDEKRDPRDFALWKVDPKHLMQWDPHSDRGWPAGDYARFQALCPKGVDAGLKAGFPGWHIECSAMSQAQLGAAIDLHTGGEDNIFPHHECEIAQSYGAYGTTTAGRKSFARCWVHGRHLLVDGKKMEKRSGNFYTVRDLQDLYAAGKTKQAERLEAAGFPGARVPPEVLRYGLISVPYVQPMNFTFDALAQAKANVERLQRCFDRLRERAEGPDSEPREALRKLLASCEEEFDAGLDNNLNMPVALAAVLRLVGELNALEPTPAEARLALRTLEGFDAVLDVLDRRVRSGLLPKAQVAALVQAGGLPGLAELEISALGQAEVERFIAARQAAKQGKDFALADGLREKLKARGVLLEDTPQGVRWRLS